MPPRPPLAEPAPGRGGLLPPSPPATYPSRHAAQPVASDPRRRRPGPGPLTLLLLIALVAAVVAAGTIWALRGSGSVRAAGNGRIDVKRVLDGAEVSVVSIETGATNGVFGGAGSGFIVSKDGYIVTNNHVIAGSDKITVHLSDGTTAAATLVGSFPANDIAMIKASGRSDLKPARIGSSQNLQVGDDVVAIGNALNLGGEPSVTLGIVSAKDRSISSGNINLQHLVQTDAAINPGNSGGPLVNASGEVVGINTAIVQDAQNIGFSISIDSVKPLIDQLKAGHGAVNVDTATLGVNTVDVSDPNLSPQVLKQYAVTADRGAFIAEVTNGSGAAAAGLAQGDVITAIDGRTVASAADVTSAIRNHKAGDQVQITYEHRGKQATVAAKLQRRGG